MRKPQVGETVYLKPINNELRRSSLIKECTVTKVGRKYFDVCVVGSQLPIRELLIDTLRDNRGEYLPNWQAYYSLQEIEDEKEKSNSLLDLRRFFDGPLRSQLTLDQLRRIKAITEEGRGDE